MIEEFIARHRLKPSYIDTVNKWFIPLANEIYQHLGNAEKPLMIGLNGCQGSGKSTLVDFIAKYLNSKHQLNVVTLSLDDFYYDQHTRNELAQDIHPLLATRGVPGTHNIKQLADVLNALKQGRLIQLPKFNKAIDNPFPKNQWPHIQASPDIILLEGWCWGVLPQGSGLLSEPVNALEKFKDQSYIWREYVNNQLLNHYVPLYSLMDKWVMLRAPSFDQVLAWRWQQEQKLAIQHQQSNGSSVMDFDQVSHFISYFQRLTEHALQSLPDKCDLVFSLGENREIQSKIGSIS